MASRVTLYGEPNSPDIKRLKREMNVMYVEYEQANPKKDERAQKRLQEWGSASADGSVVVEVLREDGAGSVFLPNPDEPTLRQILYSEGILSVTSYWL